MRGALLEAPDVVATVRGLLDEGVAAQAIAVLYRSREQGIGVLAELAAAKIAIETEDLERLRSSRVAALVAAYLRLATAPGPATLTDAWRIVYAPGRFVQKEALGRQLEARRGRLSGALADGALARELGQPKAAVEAMAKLSRLLELIRWTTSTREAAEVLAERGELDSQLCPASASEERRAREDAELAAILRLFASFDVAPALAERALREWDPTLGRPPQERVWASTIHRAKGREWRCVVLPRLAEGLCPARSRGDALPGSDDAPAGVDPSPWLEQERRIFYVGLTRASERVYLQASPEAPSRFLAELRGGAS
ncbi:MAG: 3'-5' exonuclease [Nannocystaceae bacterium]